jgi:hypothetical protein
MHIPPQVAGHVKAEKSFGGHILERSVTNGVGRGKRGVRAREVHDFTLPRIDFNLPKINWQTEPPSTSVSPELNLLEVFQNLGLSQLISEPTRVFNNFENVLDLLLCDAPTFVACAKVVPGVSDHYTITATLSLSIDRPNPASRVVFYSARADWESLQVRLTSDLEPIDTIDDVETCWDEWKKNFFAALEENVPFKRAGKNKKSLVPWMSKGLKKLMAIRDELFSKWLKVRTLAARNAFLAARKATQSAIRTAKGKWMWEIGCGLNAAKNMWRFINSKAKAPAHTRTFKAGGKMSPNPKRWQQSSARPSSQISRELRISFHLFGGIHLLRIPVPQSKL